MHNDCRLSKVRTSQANCCGSLYTGKGPRALNTACWYCLKFSFWIQCIVGESACCVMLCAWSFSPETKERQRHAKSSREIRILDGGKWIDCLWRYVFLRPNSKNSKSSWRSGEGDPTLHSDAHAHFGNTCRVFFGVSCFSWFAGPSFGTITINYQTIQCSKEFCESSVRRLLRKLSEVEPVPQNVQGFQVSKPMGRWADGNREP